MSEDWQSSVSKELSRMSEDTLYTFKGHFESADQWQRRHWMIGTPAAILAAISGTSALANAPTWITGSAAFMAAALTAMATVLNPSDRARQHLSAGNSLKFLNQRLRTFERIELEYLTRESALTKLEGMRNEQARLNEGSPQIGRTAYERARLGIENGEADYVADHDFKPSLK